MFNDFDDVITVEDLCKMLKIGKNKAYKLLSTGLIRSIKIGKTYKIPKIYVLEFLKIR
jgi:excisionase family DNA binding protein